MKKKILISSIVLSVIALLSVIGWRIVEMREVTSGSSLVLNDLPTSYCPARAWLTVQSISSKETAYDRRVSVSDCNSISLGSLITSNEQSYSVTVKLEKALAFSQVLTLPLEQNTSYFPQLGDANGDNIIDKADEELVQQNLSRASSVSSEAKSADIDNDGEVTVLDLSLVQLHRGVGVNRIDGKAWGL